MIVKEALGVPTQRYHRVGTSVGSRMTPEDAPDTGRSAAGNIVKPIVESSSGCCRSSRAASHPTQRRRCCCCCCC
jgi:hypothetical protein